MAEADVISCATLSKEPLVEGDWLREGQHIDLVGAYTPEMRESDDKAVWRARVYVDTREGALKEAGDIVQAIRNGTIDEDDVIADLFELARRPADRPARRRRRQHHAVQVGRHRARGPRGGRAGICHPERSEGSFLTEGSLGLRPRDDSFRLLRLDQRAGLLQRLDLGVGHARFGQHRA